MRKVVGGSVKSDEGSVEEGRGERCEEGKRGRGSAGE